MYLIKWIGCELWRPQRHVSWPCPCWDQFHPTSVPPSAAAKLWFERSWVDIWMDPEPLCMSPWLELWRTCHQECNAGQTWLGKRAKFWKFNLKFNFPTSICFSYCAIPCSRELVLHAITLCVNSRKSVRSEARKTLFNVILIRIWIKLESAKGGVTC